MAGIRGETEDLKWSREVFDQDSYSYQVQGTPPFVFCSSPHIRTHTHACGSQSMVGRPCFRGSVCPTESLKKYFHSNTKMLFVFFTSFSREAL